MGLKVFIDGKHYEKEDAKISVFDHGLLYGDGVFEGIRSYGGKVFRLDQHIERLYDGAKAIQLTIPMTPEEMKRAIRETLGVNGLRDAYIRVVCTRGAGTLGLDPNRCPKGSVIIITDSIQLYPKELYERGLEVITAATVQRHHQTVSARIKSLNYLNNILAKIEAVNNDVPEAILVNEAGYVCECTGDNIFFVKRGELVTPPVTAGILRGITRDAVIELARGTGRVVREELFTRYELFTADECFLTGTAAEVIPVIRIDARTIGDGKPGPVTAELRNAFHKLTGEG
ncbi:MAG: branched-chain-amino-acid transaminase [Planctomycetota bacterium]